MKVDEGAAAWEATADGWAEMMRTGTGPGQTRNLILDGPHLQLLGEVRGKRILDAGCGEGRFARMLAERGAAVTAIDLSRRMLELARAHEAKARLGIEYVQMSMTDLSQFADESFDGVVVMRDIIEPVPDEQVLAVRDYLRKYVRAPGMIIFECVKARM